MSIEKTENLLRKFDYNYKKEGERIEIKLDLGLRVTADFSEDGKIKLEKWLVTWNFLTGTLDMSLNRGIIFNFIGTFVFTGFFFIGFKQDDYITLSIMLLIFVFTVLLWSNFYITKAEHMKHTLIRWNED